MIESLSIEDLGVIESATLPLGPGFTAITGETGAGKTMVITALSLLMGARSDAGTVRSGAERARITGIVNTSHSVVKDLVEDAGGEVEDRELVIVRTVNREGRSRANAGGIQVPAQTVQKISPLLFALHGQSDQLRLKTPQKQRETLDSFGGGELRDIFARHAQVFRKLKETAAKLEELSAAKLERVREAERRSAEIAEIEAADPVAGELEDLKADILRLSNIEELRLATMNAKELLSSSGADPFVKDAQTLVGSAIKDLERVSEADPKLKTLYEVALEVSARLDDLVLELGSYSNSLSVSGPEELASANARLELLTSLTRKYGYTIEEVLQYQEESRTRLSELTGDDELLETLEKEITELSKEQLLLQTELTEKRVAVARELSEKVTEEIKNLALPDAEFYVSVTPGEPAAHGADTIEMMLKPHPGVDPRPIAKGASGGELSRVMLALEVALAGKDPVPTFVFDEVDAGVGGQAAIEIGRRLKRLAKTAQVIVVTHLAQVAAFADNHLVIQKDSNGGFTKSSVKQLSAASRNTEMARLLSGLPDSENALKHAAELLSLASLDDSLQL